MFFRQIRVLDKTVKTPTVSGINKHGFVNNPEIKHGFVINPEPLGNKGDKTRNLGNLEIKHGI